MSKLLQTKRARTSLIDAEWDWIANRLTEHSGGWKLASVVNPSFARIAYAPGRPQTLPGIELSNPAPKAEPSRTLKSTAIVPPSLAKSPAGRPSVRAVLLTTLAGLALGALLHRATTTFGSYAEASAWLTSATSSEGKPNTPSAPSPVALPSTVVAVGTSQTAGVAIAPSAVAATLTASIATAALSKPVEHPRAASTGALRARPRWLAASRKNKATVRTDNPY